MISAKDEFFIEREQINELASLIKRSDLDSHEIDKITFDLSEEQYHLLKRELIDREIKERERARRGQVMWPKQINKAVKQAADDE